MIISVSGHGCTGSSAVEDILKEYEEIQAGLPEEFTLLYMPDGLLDLEYHLVKEPQRFWSSDVAIHRFVRYIKKEASAPHGFYNRATNGKFLEISQKYVERITQLKWRGYWYYDLFDCSELVRTLKFRIFDRFFSKIERRSGHKMYSLLDRPMYLSVHPDEFYEHTKQYLKELFEAMGYDLNTNIVLNQVFAGNNPTSGMQFFDGAKSIVVDRDPRDVYMIIVKYVCTNAHWIASDTVEEFVKYYKYTRKNVDYSSKDVLYVQFEDLVYKTEQEEKRLEEFLNIKSHGKKNTFFKPEESKNNTQLFLNNEKYADDIAYIERELKEYLYDFSEFEKTAFEEKKVY